MKYYTPYEQSAFFNMGQCQIIFNIFLKNGVILNELYVPLD